MKTFSSVLCEVPAEVEETAEHREWSLSEVECDKLSEKLTGSLNESMNALFVWIQLTII